MSIDKHLLLTTKFPELFTKHTTDSHHKFTQANLFMDAIKELVLLCGDDPES